eukprot:4438553-Prymnesium_polylepis.2
MSYSAVPLSVQLNPDSAVPLSGSAVRCTRVCSSQGWARCPVRGMETRSRLPGHTPVAMSWLYESTAATRRIT